ncbi:hypothetical protein ACIRST_10120 [Kitasatospora sp. NPDC101447]|uniref:hypothetical protein n=1 Tax=Kitasatospora sp. NPDC101447 TaxID=3364102 RepID=UPI0037F1B4B0
MRIHRSVPVRDFTVLPNNVLQYRRLSYTARGLLADLLSRPDGWQEDGRQMADTSPQGRSAVRKALKELIAAGYYRVVTIRLPDGTLRTENHVYDTPQLPAPATTPPAPGGTTTGGADALPKNQDKEPSLPAAAERDGPEVEHRAAEDPPPPPPPPAPPDERTREAVAALFRAIRPEPRLHLGEAEARKLAPLVARWLERGATHTELAQALLPGLPAPLHSAAGVIRYRLENKMPPERAPARPAAARYAECAKCHDPVPKPGICRPCAGLGAPTPAVGGSGATTLVGVARARAALRAARTTALGLGGLAQPG